jgi:RNA polymerase sigma-70 factor (ECF subfamily)
MATESVNEPTEKELVERCRGGETDACEALFARYEAAARALVERKLHPAVRRKIDPEDVLQDVHLVATRRFDEFEGRHEGSYRRWLLQITEFKLSEYQRHYLDASKRSAHREKTRGARPDTHQFRASQTSPSQAAMRRELGENVESAMERLPPDYREILALVQSEGLDLRAAAERMGRSYEATKKLHGRAIKRLRTLLGLE